MVDVREIPGIGKTFRRDLACIGITTVEDVRGRNPHDLFARHAAANEAVGHATSKNYLYVLRMAVYYGDGGRDPDLLRWSAWSDAAVEARAG